MRPVHLDDIHYIMTDENAAVSFWTEHFGAKEMAQPLVPFHFIRNVSVRLFDPTIVISAAGPYGSSSEKADARWRARQRVDPRPDLPPHYGVHRLQSPLLQPQYPLRLLLLALPFSCPPNRQPQPHRRQPAAAQFVRFLSRLPMAAHSRQRATT